MDKKFAYIELLFQETDLKSLKKILNDVVKDSQFYYSDVVPRIHGDVTDKAHLTLFYGIDESELKNIKLEAFIKEIDVKEVKLQKLILIKGYQGLYKVLSVEVADEDGKLSNLSRRILEFDHNDTLGKRDFILHITLAYVQPDYELPSNYLLNEVSIRVKKARLSI